MSFYGSEVEKHDLLAFLGDAEQIANLKFSNDLKFDTEFAKCHRDDIYDEAMTEIADKCCWIVSDANEIKRLCLDLAEKIHMYMKNLPKVQDDAHVIYDKWLKEEKVRDEEQRKITEEHNRRDRAKVKCRSKLDDKISQARCDIREFENACWRQKLRRFIADSLRNNPDIAGKDIANRANRTGLFSKTISPQMIYAEWNNVRQELTNGVFGTNYPDNIVTGSSLMESVKANHVIKDTDLSGLLKKELSIYDILDMLNAVSKITCNTGCVIPTDDLAYEKFMENNKDESIADCKTVINNLDDDEYEYADDVYVDELDDFLPDE